ncbi:hypothetical protein PHSY_005930 [Pseudozyma hubeiensis SY62]|uniref:Pre-mRNA-processing factor 17 n=1 Tax=Pseudozyma hubeiensis (strain SY62) TaxID=1305764 RepID=R9PAU8_PSEHS|nr:hypothetical protein PHSY_005930 [Pseudozyma hubeiensis SY62]GAC98337.1 hypothetical protein PHSY_005930 [Pseudozyma hubeiensis SY62]
MDALAGYSSDDSDVAEQSAPKLVKTRRTPTSTEPLEYDPSDAFGLSSLKAQQASTSHNTPQPPVDHSPRKSRASRKNNSTDAAATPSASTSTQASSSAVALAPKVIDNSSAAEALLMRPGDTTMHVNIPYADMTAPQLGPQNPFAPHTLGAQQNTVTGHVESTAVSDFDFRNQQRTFHIYGYARDPSLAGSSQYVGDQRAAAMMGGASAADVRAAKGAVYRGAGAEKARKKKRDGTVGDPGVVDGEGAYVGPWAKWKGDENVAVQLLGEDSSVGPTQQELKAAQAKADAREKDKLRAEQERKKAEEEEPEKVTEKSIFHGKSMYDYQGRTYMHVPTDVDVNLSSEPGEQQCFLPKTCIHTFRGHTKGISTVKLLPGSGHLLLSASLDTTVKLWDVYHDRACLRTFMGHTQGVRDVAFSPDGRRFLSTSYDRHIKLWDTETGACLSTFTPGSTANCLTFHPSQPDTFLAGMSDKKILQYHIPTSTITQEYTSHLGSINTLTFVDADRRFVSTSDDKTLRVWDYDIPVVVKYVADPGMHSMPSVSLSPSGKWLVAQSMDNTILAFAADGMKQNRKKVFKGHNVAGFGCEVGWSPDGRFVSSGDGKGDVCFWDWKSARLLKRLRGAHAEAVSSHVWLTRESSKVVTAGWDGLIKLWD